MIRSVIGIDPGGTTGLARLDLDGVLMRRPFVAYHHIEQATPAEVLPAVERLIGARDPDGVLLAIEDFVVGMRTARSSHQAAGRTARELISTLQHEFLGWGAHVVLRSASHVKPWATDARLDAAGLLAPCKGMGHARDAARHALFAAVRDCGLPDPLSRSARPRGDT